MNPMNPLYQMQMMGMGQQTGYPVSQPVVTQMPMWQPMSQPMASGGPAFQNPVQKMQYIMQAMSNPAAFVKQHFPDIPNQIANDPNQIFNYLQQTRNPVSNDMVQQARQQANAQMQGQMPYPMMGR